MSDRFWFVGMLICKMGRARACTALFSKTAQANPSIFSNNSVTHHPALKKAHLNRGSH
jgi:hypothetical protein